MQVNLLGLFELGGQLIESQDIVKILILVILEGVLSIDNALVLGLLAKRLPRNERASALSYGLIGAFVFRVLAVVLANYLLKWTIAKFLGGAYLVYIAVKHLFFESHEKEDAKIELDEHGHPKFYDAETGGPLSTEREELELQERQQPMYLDDQTRKRLGLAAFWPTVMIIELTDVAFAVDSILAAIAFVGSPPVGHNPAHFHPKLWLVVAGGILGVMLMRYAATVFIKLLEKFPRFEVSAYLLVIVIGSKLLLDWACNSDWSFNNAPVIQAKLGKERMERFEEQRREKVHAYEGWLEKNWMFPPSKWEEHIPPEHQNSATHTPHLLNFHQNTRPEAITFWIFMVLSFCYGFIPPKKKKGEIPLGDQSE